MSDLRYKQQSLMGSNTVGFRNTNDEPWIKYRTPQHGAILSFDRDGHYPLPEWIRAEVTADVP